jgi:hypothetical protein
LDWEFGDFLKTEYADILEDTWPREPGYPSGARLVKKVEDSSSAAGKKQG